MRNPCCPQILEDTPAPKFNVAGPESEGEYSKEDICVAHFGNSDSIADSVHEFDQELDEKILEIESVICLHELEQIFSTD